MDEPSYTFVGYCFGSDLASYTLGPASGRPERVALAFVQKRDAEGLRIHRLNSGNQSMLPQAAEVLRHRQSAGDSQQNATHPRDRRRSGQRAHLQQEGPNAGGRSDQRKLARRTGPLIFSSFEAAYALHIKRTLVSRRGWGSTFL